MEIYNHKDRILCLSSLSPTKEALYLKAGKNSPWSYQRDEKQAQRSKMICVVFERQVTQHIRLWMWRERNGK
jgi:hypothetical protein